MLKYYTDIIPVDKIINGTGFTTQEYYDNIDGNRNLENITDSTPWLIAEDNIAYSVIKGEGCSTIEEINKAGAHKNAVKKACAIVVVDLNGVNNAPNQLEPLTFDDNIAELDRIHDIADRYYIYIGKNGATSGSRNHTIVGKIISGIAAVTLALLIYKDK